MVQKSRFLRLTRQVPLPSVPVMSASPRARFFFLSVLLTAACAHTPPSAFLTTGGDADSYIDGPLALDRARIKESVCHDVPARAPEFATINERTLVLFLNSQGFTTRVERARSDLVYVDLLNAGETPVRLRVAILPTPYAAAEDLHRALLEHGDGSWGVHRANVAVLAPIGSLDQIVSLASRTKLACWGVLTLAGRDDTFVIPGGYTAL